MKVSSASTADTSAGTGAQSVEISGLDANYGEISETISLNGQTAVNTIKKYLRVFRCVVRSAGSGGKNAGIVYVGTGAVATGKPAVVHALVEVGLNQTLMALYTISRRHRGYLMHFDFGSSIAKAVTCVLQARPIGEVFQVKDYRQLVDGTIGPESHVLDVFEPKTDIELQAKATGGGGDISGHIDIWLVEI